MTGFRGWTETEAIVDPLTPETLRPLLLAAAAFVVVDSPGRGPGHLARASRTGPERWSVEVHAGGEGLRLGAEVNTDAVFDLLRSWAAGDGWWEDAFRWSET